MTGRIVLLTSYMIAPAMHNSMGSCSMDAVINSKLYTSGYEFTQEEQQEMLPLLENYRDRLWDGYCTGCQGANLLSMLNYLREENVIRGWQRVNSKGYRFQPGTIADLYGIADGSDVFRVAKEGERTAPFSHVVAIVADIGSHYVVYTDRAWNAGTSPGYALMGKDDWGYRFYILKF